MRAAVVDTATNVVVNVIVVEDLNGVPPAGCFLSDADNSVCGIGWVYDPIVNDFVDPNPPPVVNEEGSDAN